MTRLEEARSPQRRQRIFFAFSRKNSPHSGQTEVPGGSGAPQFGQRLEPMARVFGAVFTDGSNLVLSAARSL